MLTHREREIVALVLAGLTYREIASRLGIKRPTVDSTVQRIAHKLPGEGRAQWRILRHGPELLTVAA